MGYDQPVTLPWKNYGLHPPTLAWKEVMNRVQDGLEAKAFPTSDGVVTADYCTESGMLATANCPEKKTGYYKKDHLPDPCTVHP